MQVTKLESFKTAKTKMPVHLYKKLLLPIIEYPEEIANRKTHTKRITLANPS